VRDPALHDDMVAILGFAEDHVRIRVGKHNLTRAPVEGHVLALVAREIGADRLQARLHGVSVAGVESGAETAQRARLEGTSAVRAGGLDGSAVTFGRGDRIQLMRGLDVMRGLAGLMMSLLALAVAVPGAGPSLVGPPCAAATAQTLVSIDGNVAERIYRDELVGTGTIADQHQVEENGPLLKALARVSALAKGSAPAKGSAGARAVREAANAVTEAVHGLVYSHTHIVRLRVLQGGKLLADIGGPYIIAPVGGSLRFHGRVVGTYLLSVQDDLGFVGLERRLVGAPLILHVGAMRVPLQGTTRTGSVAIPDSGPVVIRGAHFQAYSFDAKAFPTGVVRISLLLAQGGGLGGGRGSALSCAAVKVADVGLIAHLIWLRFVLNGSSTGSF